VLAERAKQHRATLVVLGRKRRGPLERALSGRTAHYLVRALDIPILLGTRSSIRRVLAAIDVSPAAAPTLEEARRLASALGAELRVLHVVSPVRYPRVVPRAPDRKLLERQAAEAFERFASELGVTAGERTVRRGSPETEIAAEAARWKADVVVVGSHGKGFVDRLLIGSTAEWLLDRLATASLLVVPAGRGAGALPA
jgi:nucleotide-binding universal stress UspA family protein